MPRRSSSALRLSCRRCSLPVTGSSSESRRWPAIREGQSDIASNHVRKEQPSTEPHGGSHDGEGCQQVRGNHEQNCRQHDQPASAFVRDGERCQTEKPWENGPNLNSCPWEK